MQGSKGEQISHLLRPWLSPTGCPGSSCKPSVMASGKKEKQTSGTAEVWLMPPQHLGADGVIGLSSCM